MRKLGVERGQHVSGAPGDRLSSQERWFASFILERQRTHRTTALGRIEQKHGPEGMALWAVGMITAGPGMLTAVLGFAVLVAPRGHGSLLTLAYSLHCLGLTWCFWARSGLFRAPEQVGPFVVDARSSGALDHDLRVRLGSSQQTVSLSIGGIISDNAPVQWQAPSPKWQEPASQNVAEVAAIRRLARTNVLMHTHKGATFMLAGMTCTSKVTSARPPHVPASTACMATNSCVDGLLGGHAQGAIAVCALERAANA